jgi:ferredoxin-NADP reductase
MVLRLKGLPDELSPRNLIHALLALILLPLLAAKVIVARYYKSQTAILKLLGSFIAGISFVVVMMNVGSYLLRNATSENVSGQFSAAAISACAAVCIVLLLRHARKANISQQTDMVRETGSTHNSMILQLSRVERQTHDAKTLRFLVPKEHRVCFRPGQFLSFNWIIDGKTVPRCYSICSSPTQMGYIEITPKQAAKGYVSVFLNQKASIGLTVQASQPAGDFFFDEQEHRRIVLIAGGSGITPLMSMLRYIDDRCLSTEVTLLYFVRTRKDVIFERELKLLKARLQRLHGVTVLSEPDPEWIGLTGHLSRDLIDVHVEDLSSSTFFICGPPGMMKAACDLLQSMEVSPAKIKKESFGARPATINSADPNPEIRMVLVEFARTKQTRMSSSSATLLQTAETCGIRIPYSCRQGQCGTCATKLLKGQVQMDSENGLTPELRERGYILPCVSHAKGNIKIDA